MKTYKVTDKVHLFPQKGGWHYIPIPKTTSKKINATKYRGLIPIVAKIKTSEWKTSLLPMGDGTQFIALNNKVRKQQNIQEGSKVTIEFTTRLSYA